MLFSWHMTQDKAFCEGVSLDSSSCNNFQSYVRQFGFHQARMGYLYGTFEESNKVIMTNESVVLCYACV
jgi:hypothetical protein